MRCPTLSELPPPPPGKTGWPWDVDSGQETTDDGLQTTKRHLPSGTPWARVSVVTPSYNQGRFIEETIRSVLLQGYPNLEYFIMDGGSTDNTVEIIRKYEPWLAGWASEKDRGQAHAVNKGWAQSQGLILGWLNSDDLYTPQTLTVVARAWVEAAGPDMIYGDACSIDAADGFIGKKEMRGYGLKTLLLGKNMPQPAVFVSRKLLAEIGMLDEALDYALDFEFFLRAWISPDAHRFCYVPRTLAVSREYTDTKCSTGGAAFVREYVVVLKNTWQERMQSLHPSPEWRGIFAQALVRQAARAVRLRAYRLAWLACTEAVRLSQATALRYAVRYAPRSIGYLVASELRKGLH